MIVHPFFQKRVTIAPNECWLWKGSKNSWGYGRTITPQSVERAAHRISWDLHFGPPGEANVLHRCDVPACVNPKHLFLGTLGDNVQDCIAKGRHVTKRGEESPRAKLNDALVQGIRLSYSGPSSISKLAKQYGVSRRAIRFVVDRKTWRHVP